MNVDEGLHRDENLILETQRKSCELKREVQHFGEKHFLLMKRLIYLSSLRDKSVDFPFTEPSKSHAETWPRGQHENRLSWPGAEPPATNSSVHNPM